MDLQPKIPTCHLWLKMTTCETDLDYFRSEYDRGILRKLFRSVLPCAVQLDLTRVQLNVFLLIKDAVDDGLQHVMQIQHANSLTPKQYDILKTCHLHLCYRDYFLNM